MTQHYDNFSMEQGHPNGPYPPPSALNNMPEPSTGGIPEPSIGGIPEPNIRGIPEPTPHHHPIAMPDADIKDSRRFSPDKPPSYTSTAHQPPPSGFRIPLSGGGAQSLRLEQTRSAPFIDADGHSPVFLGSAIFPNAVHPCKVSLGVGPTPCRVPYGGTEYEHEGRYDLLPFAPETMEWVRTSHGRVPHGRRPVEGGYEDHGAKLYHAAAVINGVKVPGKTGEHLVRASWGVV